MPFRDTTTRDKARAQIRRSEPPCHICGQPIDYRLRWPDPNSFVVDHLIPTAAGGSDLITNWRAAHHKCNSAKAARLYAPGILRRSATLR